MTKNLRGLCSISIAVLLAAACSSATGDGEGTDDETGASSSSTGAGTSTTAPGTSSAGMTGASATSTTSPGTTDPSTTDPSDSGSTGVDTNGFITPDTGNVTDTSVEPQPLGGMCNAPQECVSEFCYVVPQLGGLCSECLVDADCGTGTCSLSFDLGYAFCAPGNQGDGCNTDEGCMGDLVCGELIDAGGIINTSFCSECKVTADCPPDELCVPQYAAGTLGGSLVCAEPGSVPNNSGCNTAEPTACDSGFCGEADLFGFLQIGVCGECIDDLDCPTMGDTCTAGAVGMGGLMGATCG